MFNLYEFRKLSQTDIDIIQKGLNNKEKKISPRAKWNFALWAINGILPNEDYNGGLNIAFDVCISAREYAEVIMPLLCNIIPYNIQESKFIEYSKLGLLKNVEPQTILGFCFEFGFGIKKDKHQAFNSYMAAAKQNYPPAQDIVGTCYHLGIGTFKDDKIAFQYFEAAAIQEFPPAENNVGRCYQLNRGVIVDDNKAFDYYTKSANKYFAPGQNHLALCFDKGIGTAPNSAKMLQYLELAVEQQYPPAQYNYGTYWEDQKDFNKAFYYYELSANQGYPHAQYKVGCCFEHGVGVLKNLKKAREYYQYAKKNGSHEAEKALNFLNGSFSNNILPMKRNFSELDSYPRDFSPNEESSQNLFSPTSPSSTEFSFSQ